MDLINTLKCVFKGYKERYAILVLDDGTEYYWPIENFPKNIISGEQINLVIQTKEDQKNEILEVQRKLLEELIN